MNLVYSEYPELNSLCWSFTGTQVIDEEVAYLLYLSNWNFVDKENLIQKESQLIDDLISKYGNEVLFKNNSKLNSNMLNCLNSLFLKQNHCFLTGETAIHFLLNYRQCNEIDLSYSSKKDFKKLRENIDLDSLGDIVKKSVEITHVRAIRYSIQAVLALDEPMILKVEVPYSKEVQYEKSQLTSLPIITKESLFVEKLLANSFRYSDKSLFNKDAIDLAMMSLSWGGIPQQAWDKAIEEYGNSVVIAYEKANDCLLDRNYFDKCCRGLGVGEENAELIYKEVQRVVNEKASKNERIPTWRL